MKNLKELDSLIDTILKNRIPGNNSSTDFILFMNCREKRETDNFLKNLGSSSVTSVTFPNTTAVCESLTYRSFTFWIFETGYSESE